MFRQSLQLVVIGGSDRLLPDLMNILNQALKLLLKQVKHTKSKRGIGRATPLLFLYGKNGCGEAAVREFS